MGNDHCGWVRGNYHNGVYVGLGAHGNVIEDNIIKHNGYNGVAIAGDTIAQIHSHSNVISRNNVSSNTMNGIGIGFYGNTDYRGFAKQNTISHNLITYNEEHGVVIFEHSSDSTNADANQILLNVMSSNEGLGIDLGANGVTYNDSGDIDTGPNQEVNFPIIEAADAYDWFPPWWWFVVSGHIDIDTDPALAVVEVYSAAYDPTGYGEGSYLIGDTVPDIEGYWSVTNYWVPISPSYVTATVTDVNGNTSEFSLNHPVTYHTGGVDESNTTRADVTFHLTKNYPNPFKYYTTIEFTVQANEHVNLNVYDITGSLVKTLVDEACTSSQQIRVWDGLDYNGKCVPSGVYFYRLTTNDFQDQKKMILLD
jgi:hypothetical protein